MATAVFFNIHLPTEAGGLNVNLADPFALLGGALFLLSIRQRRSQPAWRVSHFNLHVTVATFWITVALLIGAARFGWTDWALTNKYLGWYVLMAYGATGALITASMPRDGMRLLLTTFVAAGFAIVSLELLLVSLRSAGLRLSIDVLWYNATGFAANRNAFAFQLIMVTAAACALNLRPRLFTAILASALAALWFAGSRAGWGTMVLLFGMAIWCGALTPRRAVGAILAATALIVTIEHVWVVRWIFSWLLDPSGSLQFSSLRPEIPIRPNLSLYEDSTMAERLRSYVGASELFVQNPLFGAGLGAHVERALRAAGTPLVIHSTPLWIAAEMGLVGLVILAVPILRIFRAEIGRARHDPTARLLVLAIAGFAAMSLVHEMLYQRTFWLLLGAGLAWLAAADRHSPVSEPP